MRPLTVADAMSSPVLTVHRDDNLTRVRDLMHEQSIRHLLVVDRDRRPIGLITERDLLRQTLFGRPRLSAYVEDSVLTSIRVEDVMTTELELTTPSSDVRDAARRMLVDKLGCLPVVDDDGRLAGIVTEADFLKVVLYDD